MAKKKTEEEGGNMPAIAEERGMMFVRLEIPADIHKLFRIEAAKVGVSMAGMARRLVEEWVAKR
jgi:hypothetical protein